MNKLEFAQTNKMSNRTATDDMELNLQRRNIE